MEPRRIARKHADAQSRAGEAGANLTDVLAAGANATQALFEMEKLMVRGSVARATIYEARCNVNLVKQAIKDEIEMDYAEAANSVAETIAKGSKPLTEAQKMVMTGAMAVWLERARKDGLDWAKTMAQHCNRTGVNYP